MIINAAVSDYLYALRGKSGHTRRSAKTILDQFVAWCDVEDVSLEQLTPVHIRRYDGHLRSRRGPNGEPLSSNTLHTHITRLKAFLAWLHQEECYTVGLSERAVKRIELPKIDDKVIVVITLTREGYEQCPIEVANFKLSE